MEKALRQAMLSFRCDQDHDIEEFLRYKALEFQERKLCSVYIIMDVDKLECGEYKIEAYFTLSHKSMAAPDGASKSQIKKYSGFKDSKTLDFVLIGQLGKWVIEVEKDCYIRSDISSREILDYAFEVIRQADTLIPCRCALVECSDEPRVRRAYENYGFKFFQNDGSHNQYVKLI